METSLRSRTIIDSSIIKGPANGWRGVIDSITAAVSLCCTTGVVPVQMISGQPIPVMGYRHSSLTVIALQQLPIVGIRAITSQDVMCQAHSSRSTSGTIYKMARPIRCRKSTGTLTLLLVLQNSMSAHTCRMTVIIIMQSLRQRKPQQIIVERPVLLLMGQLAWGSGGCCSVQPPVRRPRKPSMRAMVGSATGVRIVRHGIRVPVTHTA